MKFLSLCSALAFLVATQLALSAPSQSRDLFSDIGSIIESGLDALQSEVDKIEDAANKALAGVESAHDAVVDGCAVVPCLNVVVLTGAECGSAAAKRFTNMVSDLQCMTGVCIEAIHETTADEKRLLD